MTESYFFEGDIRILFVVAVVLQTFDITERSKIYDLVS
jgi:hypothetical protein